MTMKSKKSKKKIEGPVMRSRTGRVLVIPPHPDSVGGLVAHNKDLHKSLMKRHGIEKLQKKILLAWVEVVLALLWLLGSGGVWILKIGKGGSKDRMFAQDTMLVLHGPDGPIIVLTKRSGAKERKEDLKAVRSKFGKRANIVYINGRMDFGDVIPIELKTPDKKILLIGVRDNEAYEIVTEQSERLRSTVKAITSLSELGESLGYQIVRVPHRALHLTSAMTVVGQAKKGGKIYFLFNRWLQNPTELEADVCTALEIPGKYFVGIKTTHDGEGKRRAKEEWSSTCIAYKGKVLIMKGTFPATALSDLGFEIKEVPKFKYIMIVDGGKTCLIVEAIRKWFFKKNALIKASKRTLEKIIKALVA